MHEKTTRGAKMRSALAVLGAATLLVGGIQLVATAATGGPLLLGKSNTADKTTKLKTTGNKAALSLKSKSGKAPLKVSNSTLIKKLNADLIDGKSLEQLSPTRYRMTVGTDFATGLSGAQYVSTTALPPGTYYMTMDGFVGGTDPVQCLAIDYTKLVLGDPTGYYVYEINEGSSSGIAVQGAAVAPVIAGNRVLFGCDFGTSASTGRAPQLILEKMDAPGAAPGVAPFVPRGTGGRALDNPGIR